jgi:transposase InsO family protein
VARIIADAPDKMRMFPVKVRHDGTVVPRRRAKKLRKPQHFQAAYPGHCVALDTVERFIHGCRRYVITMTDLYSCFALALATTSHASRAAGQFFTLARQLFPLPLQFVLTDNGSEFMKHFDASLRQQHLTHWHTYPKTPKMNAHDERFNRTIQEEFVDYHEPALLDPAAFNRLLYDYLLWHNTERPHWGLNLQSPLQYLFRTHPELCHMWWRDTCPLRKAPQPV